MLRRFDRIHGSGIFERYSWDRGTPEFARLNLVYGANGTGKTSLALALQLDSTDDERAANISISIESGETVRTTNGNTDGVFDRINVFSEEYVKNAQSLLTEDGSMKAILTLGEQSVEAEKRIAGLNEEIAHKEDERTKNSQQRSDLEKQRDAVYGRVSRSVVEDLTKFGGEYQSRGSYSVRVVKRRYEGSRQDFNVLHEAELNQAKQLVLSTSLPRIQLPELSVGISAELIGNAPKLLATSPVTVVLDTLQQHPDASGWVQSGQRFHTDSALCIYCGGGLPDKRKQQIEQHFSGEVEDLQSGLQDLIRQFQILEERARSAPHHLPNHAELYDDLRETYGRAVEDYRTACLSLAEWLSKSIQALNAKLEQPLKTSKRKLGEPPPPVSSETIIQAINDHNSRAADHATLVADAAKRIETHHLAAAANDLDEVIKELGQANDADASLRDDIKQMRDDIEGLGAVERDPKPSAQVLTREVARILGREELKFEASNDRYSVLRYGEQAKRLSSGERTAIALVHFMEVVARADRSLGDPIVIIDDPVSSLDSNVFLGVSTYIWTECVAKKHIAQLLLLTHNFELFRQWDIQLDGLRNDSRLRKMYSIQTYELDAYHETRNGATRRLPRLSKWPPSDLARKKVRSTYHHTFLTLANAKLRLDDTDDLDKRLDAQLLFPNLIRKFLETFLAFKRPDRVGDFTHAMRSSAAMLREVGYKGDADALRLMLTRYAHAYSHDDTPESGSVVNPDEVRQALASVFEFVECLDQDHFDGLCKVAGVTSEQLTRL